jgi:hypothetical protein
MIRDLARHITHCRTVRALLGAHDTPHLGRLYWYDLLLRDAVSARGVARVAAWNCFQRQADAIAQNYGLTNLYYAPPPGEGLRESAATVWRCASLASRPWHDEAQDPVRVALEKGAESVTREYQSLRERLATHPDNASLTERGRWTGLFFYGARGERNEELCRRCPATAALLDSLPLCRSFGFAMFSGMDPHTHVAPHCGSSNLRLRYHLGVEVPEPAQSWLRVGTERRRWQAGEVLAFDDSFEHEVEHAGERPRVVLVVDVWHPSLCAQDIAVLSHPVFQSFGKGRARGAAPGLGRD